MENKKKLAARLAPIGGLLVGGGWIPQIIVTWKTRNIEGISFLFLLSVCIGVSFFVFNAWVSSKETGDKSMFYGQLINFIPGFIMLVSYLILYFS